MAEKSEELVTPDDKISQAKELYGRGSRNYLVKSYTEAADDLSQVCKLYEDIYGQISDELGMPYLLYAKTLIALAQDENKVIDVPEEEQDDEDDDNDDEDGEENDEEIEDKDLENDNKDDVKQPNKTEDSNKCEKSTNGDSKEMEVDDVEKKENKPESDSKDKKEEGVQSKQNESSEKDTGTSEKKDSEIKDKKTESVEATEKESQAATSKEMETESSEQKISDSKDKSNETVVADKKPEANTNGNGSGEPSTSNGAICEVNEENNEEDDEAAANLQVAWEILELAAKIFERQGEKSLSKLAEVYGELAGISFENSHFDAAIADYKQSLDIHMKLPDDNRRIIAEIHYKIGLAHLMQNAFNDCIKELKKASELMDDEIEEEKQKENLTEKQKELIKDLEETKQDIIAKIVEVEETKQQSIEEFRNELSKLISTQPQASDGSGPSSSASGEASSTSSSTVEKPKATDISHLIKRKKPDTTAADVESSPAKRPAV